MINIIFYIIVTGLLVGATVWGVCRRYRRNERNEYQITNDNSESFIEEEEDNELAIL